jgi:hypothetical protein
MDAVIVGFNRPIGKAWVGRKKGERHTEGFRLT